MNERGLCHGQAPRARRNAVAAGKGPFLASTQQGIKKTTGKWDVLALVLANPGAVHQTPYDDDDDDDDNWC